MTSQRIISFLPIEQAQGASVAKFNGGGVAMAYLANGAKTQPLQGDSNFPFIKDPPQTFEPQVYMPSTTIETAASVDDYALGPIIDVRGIRELVLYLELTLSSADPIPPNPALDGTLSLLPEALFQSDDETWEVWPVGLTDLTLAEDGVPANGYSERNVFQTELLWDPGAGVSPVPTLNGTFRLVLPFDVTAFLNYRWRFGCVSGDGLSFRAWVGAVR